MTGMTCFIGISIDSIGRDGPCAAAATEAASWSP